MEYRVEEETIKSSGKNGRPATALLQCVRVLSLYGTKVGLRIGGLGPLCDWPLSMSLTGLHMWLPV